MPGVIICGWVVNHGGACGYKALDLGKSTIYTKS
jgi:hypothetical protein